FTLKEAGPRMEEIDVGEEVFASIDVTNSQDEYLFTLDEAKKLYFDTLVGGDAYWQLYDSKGNKLLSSDYNNLRDAGQAPRVLSLGPDTYRLVVQPRLANPIDYGFILRDFEDAEAVALGPQG